MKESTILVFIGILLSGSQLTYTPIDYGILIEIPHQVWTFVLGTQFLFYVIANILYFQTPHCSFILECSEYVGSTFSTFVMIQKISIIKANKHLSSVWEVIDILLFVLILLFTLFKIVYVNQPFPSEKEKRILAFDRKLRIFKIIKVLANCISFWVFGKTEFFIIFSLINVLDFILAFTQINFIDTQIESATILSTFNNILSILSGTLAVQTGFSSSVLSEIILTIVFLLIKNPVQPIVQFKYFLILEDLEINLNNIEKGKVKDTIAILLGFFEDMLQEKETSCNTIGKQKKQWSTSFMNKVKEVYLKAIYNYLICSDNDQEHQKHWKQTNDETKQQLAAESYRNINAKNKLSKNVEGISESVQLLYKKKFGQSSKINQILSNKQLFFHFLFFTIQCYNESKNNGKINWSLLDEFFLVFSCPLHRMFLIKQIKVYQLRLCAKDESFVSVARNQKIHEYLIFCQKMENIEESSLEKCLHFEHYLKEIKQQIVKCCSKESEFIEKLGAPIKNIFDFETNFKQRYFSKNKAIVLFEEALENGEYLQNEEFIYIYLTFMIVFCKAIHRTSNVIQQKFRIARKKQKQQSLVNLKLNSFIEQSVLVCCGMNNLTEYAFGEIIISNVVFRKKFGVCKNNIFNKNKNISDLIPVAAQKEKHIKLMLHSSDLLTNFNESKKDHSQYKCLLKVNLQRENFHIFQEFKIQIKVFFSFEKALCFTCILEKVGCEGLILESDLRKLEERISTKNKNISFNENIRVSHNQLGQEMELVYLKNNQISSYDLSDNIQEMTKMLYNDDLSDENLELKQFDEDLRKYETIQNVIWERQVLGQPVILRIVLKSFITFALAAFLTFLIPNMVSYKAKTSMDYNWELSETLQKSQGCQARVSLNLYLLRKIQEGRINIKSCSPYFANFKNHLINGINGCMNVRIPDFLVHYFSEEMVTGTILDAQFLKSLEPESLSLSRSSVDYSNFILNILGQGQYLSRYSLINLPPAQQKLLNKFIGTNIYVGDGSFSRKFINAISDVNTNFLFDNQLQYKILVYCGSILMILLFSASFYYVIKFFLHILTFFNLLTKLKLEYLRQRLYEMKFICKEIEKLNDFNFKNCLFPTSLEVVIQTRNFHELHEQSYPLNEFEKQAQSEFSQKQEAFEYSKSTNRKGSHPLITVLLGKKWLLLLILTFCCSCMGIAALVDSEYGDVIINGFQMIKIIRQGALTKENMSALNFQNWNLYFNDTIINPLEVTYSRYEQYMARLSSQKFTVAFFQNFNEQVLSKTAYQNVCEILAEAKLMQKKVCLSSMKNNEEMRLADLLSYIINSDYNGYKNFKDNSIKPNLNTICYNLNLIRTYLIPSITNQWKSLLNIINNSSMENAAQYYSILTLLVIFCTLTYVFMGVRNYLFLVRLVKTEVLTIDTVRDLYENASFRQHLNWIYFKT